jgi:hypothetical protein
VSRAARTLALAGVGLAALLVAPAAHAAAGDTIDDPKLARRLGSRVSAPVATTSTPPVEAAGAPQAAVAEPVRSDGAPAADLVATAAATGNGPAVASSGGSEGRTPVLGLGYRRFSFIQLGAIDPSSANGTASSEPFESLALDFYPISRTVRFGLSTQYGWQSGHFNGGDYFIAQSVSLGLQSPGKVVTPFVEAFAGAGYLRRFQFDRTIPTAYWQFGLDAGASLFVAEHGYLSVALGYLRPVNGFAKMQSFTSVYVDTWSLKIGFGI